MVDILLLQTVSITIASASVVAGVVYYALQLRHQTKIRETDLVIRLNPWVNMNGIDLQRAALKVLSLEYKDYDDFVKRYGSLMSDTPEALAVHNLINFAEGLGYLLKRNLVSVDLVYTYYGQSYVLMWDRVRPLVLGFTRQAFGKPTSSEPCEYLYNEVKKHQQKLQQKGV